MATPDDLAETVSLVERSDRRILASQADVRDVAAVAKLIKKGMSQFGRLDIVVANAGIMPVMGQASMEYQAWHDAVDILLSGVYITINEALPAILQGGRGG